MANSNDNTLGKKKRNVTKPQGTLSPDDVTNLHLRLWELRDAIVSGNLSKIENAAGALWECIPNTTTNTGARNRARNLRRKMEEAGLAKPYEVGSRAEKLFVEQSAPSSGFDNLSEEEQIASLKELWN